MRKIGMVAAVEIDAVKKKYKNLVETLRDGGFDIYHYTEDNVDLYVLHSGVGEISAAAATQLLISKYNVELILNFGVVGGLTERMNDVRLCVVEKAVHYQFDTSEVDHCPVGQYVGEYPDVYMPATPELVAKALEVQPSLEKVICASADKFVGSAEEKYSLYERFGAEICEMEAAAIIKTANRNEIPCLLIKMVADSLYGGADEYASAFEESSDRCLSVLDAVIQEL